MGKGLTPVFRGFSKRGANGIAANLPVELVSFPTAVLFFLSSFENSRKLEVCVRLHTAPRESAGSLRRVDEEAGLVVSTSVKSPITLVHWPKPA